MEKSE